MTVSEFEIWLSGFTAQIKGPLNQEQLAMINKKLSEVDTEGSPKKMWTSTNTLENLNPGSKQLLHD